MLGLLLAAALSSGAPVAPPAAEPPVGTYLCYYYGYDYALTSSSLVQVRVLPGSKMEIVGEVVPYRFDAAASRLTIGGGTFRGAAARYQLDSSQKSALVFSRSQNEEAGHKIDVSDTWCYLEDAK